MDFQLDLNTETVDQANPAEPECVSPETTIREVLELFRTHNRGSTLICKDGELKGVYTERDALKLMCRIANTDAAADMPDLDAAIESVMITSPVTLQATDTMGEAITQMSAGGYRRLPILNDAGQPVGVLKVSGILNYLVEHFPKVIYNLPPKPHHNTQQREGA